MPPNPRRRKAAKKKRTPGHRRNPSSQNNNNNNNPPGIDKVKTQDSDGDGDEFSTPAFDAYNSPFQEKRGASSAGSFSVEGPGEGSQITGSEGETEGDVTESEYQGDDATQDKDVTCSNSSFSDTEFRENEINGKDEAYNSASVAPSFGDLVSKEVNKLREKPAVEENAIDSVAVKPIIYVSDGVVCSKECVSNESSDGLTGASPTKLKSKSKRVEAVASPRGPSDVTGNGAEHTENSEIPQYSDNEPLLQVAPRQTTSWKSCCGLFELCAGSNR